MNTFELIEQWAIDRNLNNANPKSQMVKLMEEVGELARGIGKNDKPLIKDSIGDSVVVLTILAMQNNLTIEECIESAYDEIKSRTGKTINGMFVKDNK